MKGSTVSLAEAKKDFSRLVDDADRKDEETIITRRGKPVAVIVPYQEFKRFKKAEGQTKIIKARETFLRSDILASEVFKESKKVREKRQSQKC